MQLRRFVLAVLVAILACSTVARSELTATQLSGFGGAAIDPEVAKWRARVTAAGGTLASNSVTIAANLMAELRRKSYNQKIVYLLPLLGTNLAAAIVPLRDKFNVSSPANINFVDADFSQSTGLQGNGSNKALDLRLKPSQLGTGSNGGLGYWETNVNFTGSSDNTPIGCRDSATTHLYQLELYSANSGFYWGLVANGYTVAGSAANGDYYGQRSSATDRRLFIGGSPSGSNTSSDSATGVGDRNIYLMGRNYSSPTYWKGRCAVAYLTDGTLTDAEVSDLHSLLQNYLITPTGR